MNCRFCDNHLKYVFVDLKETPLANAFLTAEMIKAEKKIPLKALVCEKCFLVQVDEFENPENIFKDYAYFSSFSSSWLKHVEDFANETIRRFNLNEKDLIIEIASNDGYLLKNFKKQKIPVLGIEPATNVAREAEKKGISTINDFFGNQTANEIIQSGKKAQILIAFNVLPHVPNLKDFVLGMKNIIKENGIIIIQFSAYLLDVIEKNEYDMIYHEHYSYFSLHTLKQIFEEMDLEIFDVKENSVHGGSLRVFIKNSRNNTIQIEKNVQIQLEKEKKFKLQKIVTYEKFQDKVDLSREEIKKFFLSKKYNREKIVGYGAAAKGNTLLNYCNIGLEFIDYVVDISPHKQGKLLPGTHIPIFSPEKIRETKPDYVVILPWNLKDEIMEQISFVRDWNGKFVTLIPEVEILE